MEPTSTPPQDHAKARRRAWLFGRWCTYGYAWAYMLAVHAAYVTYISPTFAYSGYNYLPFSTVALLSTYFLTWLPIVAYRSSAKPAPAQGLVAMIYALLYVPIQLSLLFSVERSYERLFWIQGMLALSMTVFFFVAKGKKEQWRRNSPQLQAMDRVAVAISLVAVTLMVVVNRGHMRFISFEDVYDLRFEASAASGRSVFSDYLTSWLIYCFTSYLFARGVVYRKWLLLMVGLACAILIYMCEGHKSAILLLPMTMGIRWLWGSGQNFIARLLLALTALLAIVGFVVPDEGVGVWIKSILLVRIVGSGGWLACKYYEFFPAEGLTFYSHISPIRVLTNLYPYGDLSLGQAIGLAYSGTTLANHNASFWASEGFASLGPVGILAVTPMVAGLLYAINRIMGDLDATFTVLWMFGFFVALLNVPLFTALSSGGGLIIFAQAWWLSHTAIRPRAPGLPVGFRSGDKSGAVSFQTVQSHNNRTNSVKL